MRLAAPAPSWERDVDVVVLGSGAAGLSAALAARPVRSVLVITKDVLAAGSTAWAQGGLAGVLAPDDTLEDHVRDTLAAGRWFRGCERCGKFEQNAKWGALVRGT